MIKSYLFSNVELLLLYDRYMCHLLNKNLRLIEGKIWMYQDAMLPLVVETEPQNLSFLNQKYFQFNMVRHEAMFVKHIFNLHFHMLPLFAFQVSYVLLHILLLLEIVIILLIIILIPMFLVILDLLFVFLLQLTFAFTLMCPFLLTLTKLLLPLLIILMQ